MPKTVWIVNFERHNPPQKVQHSDHRGKPLKWVRCATNWMDDNAVLTMSEETRWLWPALFALAGESTPPGHVNVDGLALRRRTTEGRLAEALRHLWRKGLIRYTKQVTK